MHCCRTIRNDVGIKFISRKYHNYIHETKQYDYKNNDRQKKVFEIKFLTGENPQSHASYNFINAWSLEDMG